MGETADQTRAQIIQLRAEMSGKVGDLRRAAERPIRVAQLTAAILVGVIVVGGIALVVSRVRRQGRGRGPLSQAEAIGATLAPSRRARRRARQSTVPAGQADERLHDEVRKQVEQELRNRRPLHEKVLTAAAQSAASAAVPIVLKKLEEQMGDAGRAKPSRPRRG